MRVITNLTRNTVLADRAELANGLLDRIIGLLARSSFSEGEALVLQRCNAIHTWFMRFPIDVMFLKTALGSRLEAVGNGSSLEPRASSLEQPQQGVVVKVIEHLKPFRFAWAMGADTVVELPVGTIARTSTQPLDIVAAS